MTKSFQSIRDKVARLLGKSEPEETVGGESHLPSGVDAAIDNSLAATPSVKWEQPAAQQNRQQPQASTLSPQSFADSGMDDLTIESRPVTPSARPAGAVAPPAKNVSGAPAEPRRAAAPSATPFASSVQAKSAPSFFATRAANAQTADDALLDLGDEPHDDSFTPANAAAADDFFLDLDDEPPSRPLPEPVKAYERHLSSRAPAVAPAKQFAAATKEAAGSVDGSAATRTANVSSSLASAVHAKAMNPEQLSPEMLDAVAHRVIERMSEQVIREIAWEVVPELADRLIKQRLDEEKPKI